LQKVGDAYKESDCFTQHFATAMIPSVPTGCYRLGMYQGATTTCDLEFFYLIDAATYLNTINANELKYVTLGIYNATNSSWDKIYNIQIPEGGITPEAIVAWANTIPGMTCFYAPEDYFTFSWQVTVDCDATYFMQSYVGSSDYTLVEELWQTDSQVCECQTQFYLYSLSNIINIDASDCFSTMLEFWSSNNTIAQGFEYVGDWKQRVRLGINGGGAKPIIEENLYRQSNGVHKRPQNKQDLSVDLHTDFLDEAAQLALVDATRHPSLVWDGKSIFVKGDIDVATTQDFTTQSSFETLSQVKFQALIQGFQPKNSSCLTC